MTAIKVESRALAKLKPYARNARTHSDEQIAQIVASIKEFGWTNAVLVDEEDTIIAGHGRALAAQKLGMAEVPVIVLRGLTDAQRRAYIIADNKLALNAGWDKQLLALDLASLQECGFDLSLTGFGDDELSHLLAGEGTEGLTNPDEAPETETETISRPGDVWILGHHRLVCGDCTDPETVARALAGTKPHLMVTDPPYGVEYDATWRNRALVVRDRAHGVVMNDSIADWRGAWALFPGDVAYVWHDAKRAGMVAQGLIDAGLEIRTQIIWAKEKLVIGRGNYHYQHEPCWYAVRKGKTGHWAGDRKQSTLWQIDKPMKSESGHSTQKPVECMRRPIINNSSPGQAVYEPFSGSGTTIIAAEMTARACHAIEILPAYVDVAVKRWQDFTGCEATLEGTCRTFAQLRECVQEVPA